MLQRQSTATPARWPALLLFMLLCLPGCSMLSPAKTDPHDESAPAQAAFTLDVRAPQDIAEYLTRHLELQRFRQLPDLQARELSRLLGAANDNARELLATLGYFSPTLTVEMTETPDSAETPRTIVVTVEPGPQTHISEAHIDFTGPITDNAEAAGQAARVRGTWSLQPGQAFSQSAWDDAKTQGLRALQTRRYPTARIAQSRAEVDADEHQAKLSVTYDSGPAYRFGPLRVQGSERYDSDGARRLARLPTGATYSEAELLDAQQRLASSGYYDAVFLTLDTEADDRQAAPVVAQVREAQLQKWVFGVGLSTDSGARLSTDHTHNRVPGIGWRAVSKLSLDRKTQLIGTEWTALPDEGGWRWFGAAQAQRQVTGNYDVNSARLRAGRSQSSARIDRNYFLQYDFAHNQGPDAPPSSAALSANYSWTGRYFNSATNPTRGYGLAWELGAGTTLRPQRDPFVRATGRWLAFVPLGRVEIPGGPKRDSRLALRAEGGAVLAREDAPVPVTQMFLTGGDTTVRGYSYRSIGARTANELLYGGRYLAVTSIEWQRPIAWRGNFTDWESTLFADVGAVGDRASEMHPRVGVGAGVRWRSPVGPLQADLAYGVQVKQLRLHLRLGFHF